ncbi:hypothetical protein AURDEDRAFT_160985 [Auricularia subglabra TFB-10046 SS5]|nr:hypothetical protein AURDEDRAFT_160985 [Auricularia subglabra TFB-10046 SS5]
MHSSSWIWHCVWARWLRDKEDLTRSTTASLEIGRVVDAYHRLVKLDYNYISPIVISQALVFQCSLRTDLSPNIAVELILRVASAVGLRSRWILEAVQAVLFVYRDHSIHLSDDLAVGMFNLAASYTASVLEERDNSNSGTYSKDTSLELEITRLLYRGSAPSLCARLLPGMCALALQRLRECPPDPAYSGATRVMTLMVSYLSAKRCDPEQLHTYPGIIFPAGLAAMTASLWPDYAQSCFKYEDRPRSIYVKLVEIASGQHANAANEASPEENRSHASLPDTVPDAVEADLRPLQVGAGDADGPPVGHKGEANLNAPDSQ